MNSGRVDEHDLPGFASLLLGDVDDSENAVARGLGLRRNDGQLLAHQRIQQRALARIGPSENANESGVKGHEYRLLASGCWLLANCRAFDFSWLFTSWYWYPPLPPTL